MQASNTSADSESPTEMPETPEQKAAAHEDFTARLQILVDRANSGDAVALDDLRQFLRANPEITEQVGNLARHTEVHWIARMAGADLLRRESLTIEVEKLKAKLGGDNPSPVLEVVVDHIASCYLAERSTAADVAASAESIKERTFQTESAESAQRRLQTALQLYSRVQGLAPNAQGPTPPIHLFVPKEAVA